MIKKIVIGVALIGVILIGIGVIRPAIRFYKKNLRGMSNERAQERLHVLSDAIKRNDEKALIAEYDGHREFWENMESKNEMVTETAATFLATAYKKIGRNKEAAYQYYKLALLAQKRGQKEAVSSYIGQAAGLDSENREIEAVRRAINAPITLRSTTSQIENVHATTGIIRVLLSPDGRISLDQKPCDPSKFVKTLRSKLAGQSEHWVFIYAVPAVPEDELKRLFEKAREAGAKNIQTSRKP